MSTENKETRDYEADLIQYKPFVQYTMFSSFAINKETKYVLIGAFSGLILQILAKEYLKSLEYEKKNKPNDSSKNERRITRVIKKIKGGDFIISPALAILISETGAIF